MLRKLFDTIRLGVISILAFFSPTWKTKYTLYNLKANKINWLN